MNDFNENATIAEKGKPLTIFENILNRHFF